MAENQQLDEQFTHAVMRAAETMNQPPYGGERLHKAADLVLTGSVSVNGDGRATVKSGSHTYQIDSEDGCTCEDARRRSKWCKHTIAVELLKRAQAQMDGQDAAPAPVPPAEMPSSAAWHVQEAQASCCLKFQMGAVECMYTMRDVNDDLLFVRVRRILPKLLEKANGSANGSASGHPQDVPMCPLHHVPMKRFTKGDQVWYSHKAPDGKWCRGK